MLLPLLTCILVSLFCDANASELSKISRYNGLNDLFSSLKKIPSRGATFISDFALSIPFTKILLAGGALLGILFMFIRLLIVLGPIIILGAMTRESTDATDLLKMLIEFYNQVIVALDDQPSPSSS